jgi:quercetin dioxygenase-like cupin family protein
MLPERRELHRNPTSPLASGVLLVAPLDFPTPATLRFLASKLLEPKTMKRIVLAIALLGLAGAAAAEDMKVAKPDSLKWVEHPIFKGAQTAILIGDPSKAEPIVQRVKFPRNYKVAPHTHPYAEAVTVLSGTFGNAMGEKFDPSKGEMLPAGSTFWLPANHPHYVWTTDQEVTVQINFTGPGGITFIDPADDPRKK